MNIVNLNNNNKSPYTLKAAFKANIPDTSQTLHYINSLGLRHAFETAIIGKSEKGVNRQLRKIQSFINKSKDDLFDSYKKISDFILTKARHRVKERNKGKFNNNRGIAIIVGVDHSLNSELMRRLHEIGNPVLINNADPVSIVCCHDDHLSRIAITKLIIPPEIYSPKIESDYPLGLKNNHEAMKPIKPAKFNLYKRHFGIHNRKW